MWISLWILWIFLVVSTEKMTFESSYPHIGPMKRLVGTGLVNYPQAPELICTLCIQIGLTNAVQYELVLRGYK